MNANKSKKISIVMTGGGTAGHVVPHLALVPNMVERSWTLSYIGSSGIEKKMIEEIGIDFYTISAGKLRRYFSFQNFLDIFKVVLGFFQSLFFLRRIKPNIVFSKGGFVSVPVALAAWILRVPVITHESDLTPGLANKIVKKFCKKILFTFPETEKYLPTSKSVYVGSPVRQDIFKGSKELGYDCTGFNRNDPRPIVLVMGGSLGAASINNLVAEEFDLLVKDYRIIHITGHGKKVLDDREGYVSFEFVGNELPNLFAITDYVIARAGANSIFEFLALNLPMLLIPLEVGSRGDQLQNASSFVASGFALMSRESDLAQGGLRKALDGLVEKGDQLISNQRDFPSEDALKKVIEQIELSA